MKYVLTKVSNWASSNVRNRNESNNLHYHFMDINEYYFNERTNEHTVFSNILVCPMDKVLKFKMNKKSVLRILSPTFH